MTTMRDIKGNNYIMRFFDRDEIELDPNRLQDGDWLKDPRVYKTTHETINPRDNSWYIMGNGSLAGSNGSMQFSDDGGVCQKCHLKGPFFVVQGKEYCGLCNEFYDTYAYMRTRTSETDVLKHKLQIAERMYSDAQRRGDFIRAQQYKKERDYLEEKFMAVVEDEAETAARFASQATSRNAKMSQAQSDYIRKALMNRPPDHDINF